MPDALYAACSWLGHQIAHAGRWFDGLPMWWRAVVGVLVLLGALVLPMAVEWCEKGRAR